MVEIHICPILMRTVRFINGKCDSQEKNCDGCPIQEEINNNAMEDTTNRNRV